MLLTVSYLFFYLSQYDLGTVGYQFAKLSNGVNGVEIAYLTQGILVIVTVYATSAAYGYFDTFLGYLSQSVCKVIPVVFLQE